MSHTPASLFTLPRDLTPQQFFETHLAAELARVTLPAHSTDARCAFTVTGAGGGTWSVGAQGGRATLTRGELPDAAFLVRVSAADWRELVVGDVRDRLLHAAGGAERALRHYQPQLLAHLFLSPHQLSQVSANAGELVLRLEDDDEGREYTLSLVVSGRPGATARPRTTATVDLDTCEDLVRGRLKPQQALMQGRVLVEGDISLPMGLLSAMVSP